MKTSSFFKQILLLNKNFGGTNS